VVEFVLFEAEPGALRHVAMVEVSTPKFSVTAEAGFQAGLRPAPLTPDLASQTCHRKIDDTGLHS
jgi:hypothetical protein